MKPINIKPVKIIGTCPATLSLDDEFQIERMKLGNPRKSNICFLAFSHFPISVWQLQSESRFFSHASCPGCISELDDENRVVFLLGHADKWQLCQIISEYLRLSKQYEEPEIVKRLKEESIQHQNRGEYSEATQKMDAALKEWRRVTVLRGML